LKNYFSNFVYKKSQELERSLNIFKNSKNQIKFIINGKIWMNHLVYWIIHPSHKVIFEYNIIIEKLRSSNNSHTGHGHGASPQLISKTFSNVGFTITTFCC